MIFGSHFKRFGRLGLLAAAVAVMPGAPASAQPYDERYDAPPASTGSRDRDYDRDDDRNNPAWRDDDRRDGDRDVRGDDGPPRDAASLDAFYDALDEYGRWRRHPVYGDIWIPGDTERDWRPYTRGQWIYTEDYGWYWSSTEPWGWATYHYGRWAWDDRYGWFWIPDTEWAPAWVSWRYSDDFIGWAPLPPRRHRWRDDDDYFLSARNALLWVFVRPRDMLLPNLHRFASPAGGNTRILGSTRAAPLIGASGPRGAANRGVDLRLVERLVQRPITPARIAITENRRDPGLINPRSGSITILKPRALPQAQGGQPSRWSQQPQGGGPGNAPGAATRRAGGASGAPPSGVPAAAPSATTPGGSQQPNGDRRRPPSSPPPAAAAPSSNPPAAASAPAAPTAAPPPSPPPREHRDEHRGPPANAAPQGGTPVQPRILNQQPPQAASPPPRPTPPPPAANPPPRQAAPQQPAHPAPPAAAAGQPKDQKGHDPKKKPDEPPPAPPPK